MLSKKAKYALKALMYLAEQPENEPTLIATIAEHEQLPKKFLDAILLELRNRGILRSRKGRGGGYLLAQPPELINIATVMRLIDGPVSPVRCVSKTAYERCSDCRDEDTCRIRKLMREVRDGMLDVLEQRTLADLMVGSSRLPRPKAVTKRSSAKTRKTAAASHAR
jgi:Rrf2 family protein